MIGVRVRVDARRHGQRGHGARGAAADPGRAPTSTPATSSPARSSKRGIDGAHRRRASPGIEGARELTVVVGDASAGEQSVDGRQDHRERRARAAHAAGIGLEARGRRGRRPRLRRGRRPACARTSPACSRPATSSTRPQLAHVGFAEAIVIVKTILGEPVTPVDYGKVPWGVYCTPRSRGAGSPRSRRARRARRRVTSTHRSAATAGR